MLSRPTLYLVTAASDPQVFESLRASYPGLRMLAGGAAIPLEGCAPEEVLAAFHAAGLAVRGSRVDATPEDGCAG
jgi:hypothetical protein